MSLEGKSRLTIELAVPIRERLENLKNETGAKSLSNVVVEALRIYDQVRKANGEVAIIQGETVKHVKFIM